MEYTVVSEYFPNAEKIYPTQQEDIWNLYNYFKKFDSVRQVIVYGNSLTSNCSAWSPINIYVNSDKEERFGNYSREGIENTVDLQTNYTVDMDLLDKIISEGVIIYEK